MGPVKKYMLPIAFLALLYLHAADTWLQWLPEPELKEKRALTEPPKLDINNLDPFPKKYEAYYNDHFNWRNHFIKAGNYLNYHAFQQSGLPDKVIIGKDGWLFRSGFQMEMYQGRYRFSPKELHAIQQELEYRRQKMEELGGHYYLAIPPIKAQLYHDFLPETHARRLNPETCAEQLIHHLQENSDIRVIDLFQPLRALQETTDRKLFIQTDHHWTDYAGLYAAKVLVDELRRDFPALPPVDLDRYKFATVTYQGLSLAELLGLEEELSETLQVLKKQEDFRVQDGSRSYPAPAGFPFQDEYCIVKQTNQPDLPKLMMVRESFANPMLPALSSTFRESVFLFDNWQHGFHEDIVAQEQPDIYVQLIWEGMIYKLLEQSPEGAEW